MTGPTEAAGRREAGLTAGARRQVEEFVRPLYVGLDGVKTFERVERIERRVARLRSREVADDRLLELLVLFHGVVDRLGSTRADSRFDLLLRRIGVADGLRAAVRAGLARLGEAPATAEEALVHDALLLEQAGVRAAVARLLESGRKKWPVERAVAALDPGPAPARFRTTAGAERARRERERTAAWIEGLGREVRRAEGDA